jgi:hypothetical protein
MSPFELRFEIFKQAYAYANDEYQAKYCAISMWNENNSVKTNYPNFPSYEYIEQLAEKINNFVSSR